jgi:AcrR family transcriptional regulator
MARAAAPRRGRPPVEGLRERRREQILTAATRIFAQRGYPATDLQVVADAIHAGKGTLYRYFPTKEALFLAAIERGIQNLDRQVLSAIGGVEEPLARVASAIRAYLGFFSRNPDMLELMAQERAIFKGRKPTYFAFLDGALGPWRELFRRLMAQGRVRRMPFERIVDVVGDAVYGTIVTDYFSGRRKSTGEQARDLLDIVFNGILTPAGRRSLDSLENPS